MCLEPLLLKDARQWSRAPFCGMLELPVAPLLRYDTPAVLFHHFQDVPVLHTSL
jgi:hypothetical protein